MKKNMYRKPLENLRIKVDVRLVANAKDIQKLVSKTTFGFEKMFNRNFLAVQ